MPPKKPSAKKTASAAADSSTTAPIEERIPSSSSTKQQQQKSIDVIVVEPLLEVSAGNSTASILFGNNSNNTTETKKQQQQQKYSPSCFSDLQKQLSLSSSTSRTIIDQVILTSSKNEFLCQLSASVRKINNSSQILELLVSFLTSISTSVTANSFLFSLEILADAIPEDDLLLLRGAAKLVQTVSSSELRGSVSEAARLVFQQQQQQNTNNNNNVSRIFKTILQLLIAVVESGRYQTVAILSSLLDGIACAHSQQIAPQSLLKDAAHLLTALGKFATVGAPRLRGLVSAWNAPTLPAKKEAMVVEGGPFKINVAPEFEVKHMTLKI